MSDMELAVAEFLEVFDAYHAYYNNLMAHGFSSGAELVELQRLSDESEARLEAMRALLPQAKKGDMDA